MKSDAQIPSSIRPSAGATAAPIAETPVVETPGMAVSVVEIPIAETPVTKPRVQKLQLPPPPHLLPWRQAERAMANHGQNKWRPVKMMRSRGVGPRSASRRNRGG